ncbi:TonB-dependent receptor [Flavobacterium silvaticum]|uniref:TonB-dependent receptor n=1 Tax=Flavobacterium silvaticum TaxID=1852020 RepID=A0A972FNF0_9FLAO|nr:TonB-dependent receptor [Flavobacterium silvaticum]NMH28892.1 TonB-dependent receptor [Flavobacterium silvaticum]
MKKLIALVFLFWNLSGIAQNQTEISGSFQFPQGANPSEVAISLLSSGTNELVKTQLSDTSGNFTFSNIEYGSYLIVVEDLAFEPYQTEAIVVSVENPILKIPSIKLSKAATNQLNEVTIQRKKPIVENKIDKVVVNVDAMISAAAGDALEVLQKSPGIMVDQNGTITFKGKSGVSVFIDGKPTYMSGAELESYLKSLPASTLNQIELMTNPPAKYDAAGGGGLINIVTKKSNARGFNGSFTSAFTQGKRTRTRQNLSLNYLNDKIRIFGNIGYSYSDNINDLTIYRRFRNEDNSVKGYFDQNSIMTNTSRSGNLNSGIDYYMSEKTTIGARLTGILRSSDGNSDVNSIIKNAANQLDSTVVANNGTANQFKNLGVNLNVRHEFSSTSKLTADGDYLSYKNTTDQIFRNFIYEPDGTLNNQDQSNGYLPSDIDIFSFKTDYSKQFKNDITFEAGYKISSSKTDNIADYRDLIDGASVPNYNQSNHFKYDETINAAYVNGSANYKRFSFQLGLRLENTVSKGNQLGNPEQAPSKFSRNYTNLFPTAYVMWKLDSIGDNSVVMNYGKRINRPYYEDLNPFISPLDKFTFYTGNPYLNPSFANNLELSYRYKNYLSVTTSYGFTKDDINETIEIRDGIYYSRPGNIGKSRFYSVNANSEIPFADWLTTNVYSEVTRMEFESILYDEPLNSAGTFWTINVNNSLKFKNDWSAEVSGYYVTDVVSTQFVLGSRGGMSLGVQKKVLKGKGNVKLNLNDVFYTNIYTGTINNLKLTDATWVNKPDSRSVSLTFNYSFGKAFQQKNSYDASGADSEKSRVKG